ncbi:glycophorin C, partial [Mus musculus]
PCPPGCWGHQQEGILYLRGSRLDIPARCFWLQERKYPRCVPPLSAPGSPQGHPKTLTAEHWVPARKPIQMGGVKAQSTLPGTQWPPSGIGFARKREHLDTQVSLGNAGIISPAWKSSSVCMRWSGPGSGTYRSGTSRSCLEMMASSVSH